jgi:hypothetical protein
MRFVDFFYQLLQLFAFAGAYVEEADADGVAVVDGLDYAA